jgi:phytoene dehydrogenase-like protein
MAFHDVFVRCEGQAGRVFNVYTDIDQLADHLKELAPGDTPLIKEYIAAARRFTRFELLALPLYKPGEIARLVPYLAALPRWMKITLDDYASRFRDPFLRRVFSHLQYDIPSVPMGVHLGFLAGCHNRTLGTPRVDSLTFARSVEERYRQLGGEVFYRSRVKKVMVENGRAAGVRLADGSEHRAEIIISAADGMTTIFEMLEGNYSNDLIQAYYTDPPGGSQPFAAYISLGVARDLSREPHALFYQLDSAATIAGLERTHLNVEIYSGPAFAPPGKGVIMVSLDSDYDYWASLHQDRERYKEAKERDTETVIDLLENRFPGLRRQLETVDMATPLTTERYTGNYHGRQPWPPPQSALKVMRKGLSRTLPGLADFYMVGQWADAMIGISTVALAGRKLVQRLCRQERRPFIPPNPGGK